MMSNEFKISDEEFDKLLIQYFDSIRQTSKIEKKENKMLIAELATKAFAAAKGMPLASRYRG